MNTKVTLTYKGVPYTLEYDRMAIKTMEANGFSLNEFIKKPMYNVDIAFQGAFIKHHRKIKQSLVEEIYENLGNKEKFVETLITMISETYEALFEEPEGEEGNVEWEVVDLSPKKKSQK